MRENKKENKENRRERWKGIFEKNPVFWSFVVALLGLVPAGIGVNYIQKGNNVRSYQSQVQKNQIHNENENNIFVKGDDTEKNTDTDKSRALSEERLIAEKGIRKENDFFCSTKRRDFDINYITLNGGLSVNEEVKVRMVAKSKDCQDSTNKRAPKIVIMFDKNFNLFIPDKDTRFISFDNNGESTLSKKFIPIDITKEVELNYKISSTNTSTVLFEYTLYYKSSDLEYDGQQKASGNFVVDFPVNPENMNAKIFGFGAYENTCFSVRFLE